MLFHLYDRWGMPIANIGCTKAIHTEQINGEDTLSISTGYPVVKGDHIVWRDPHGKWHEHIVDSGDDTHTVSNPVSNWSCETSIAELYLKFIEDKITGKNVRTMLGELLENTRWSVGLVDVETLNETLEIEKGSTREGIQKIVEAASGEVWASYSVDEYGITERFVNISKRGRDRGKRFTYTKDMAGVTRSVEPDFVYTAMYGFGKETDGVPLTFGSANGGKNFLYDEEAMLLWGIPMADGSITNADGVYTNSDCDSVEQLVKETRAALDEAKQPRVSYSLDIIDLWSIDPEKFAHEETELGDSILAIDQGFSPELRVAARVTEGNWDLLNYKDSTVTIGNYVSILSNSVASLTSDIKSLSAKSSEILETAPSKSESEETGLTTRWTYGSSSLALGTKGAALSFGSTKVVLTENQLTLTANGHILDISERLTFDGKEIATKEVAESA